MTPLDDWTDDLVMFLKDYGQESGHDSDSIRTTVESVINDDSASIIPSTSHSLALDSVPEPSRSSPSLARKSIDKNTKIDEINDKFIENISTKNSINDEKEACELIITHNSFQRHSSHEVPNFENEKLLVSSSSLLVIDTSAVDGDEQISKETLKSCRVIGALRKDGTYESHE